jgi:hypothetical protein
MTARKMGNRHEFWVIALTIHRPFVFCAPKKSISGELP